MASAESPTGNEPPADAGWQTLRDHLERERRRVADEIRSYPRPIPACDAQFNFLLERRTRLTRELDRLDEISVAASQGRDVRDLVDAFLRSAEHIKGA